MKQNDSRSPLFRFNRERLDVIDEVVSRVTSDAIQRSWDSPANRLDYLLNEAAAVEMARLEGRDSARASALLGQWKEIVRGTGRASEEENAEVLQRVVTQYARDIAGHFRPEVFRFATGVVPSSVSMLLGARSPLAMLNPAQVAQRLRDSVAIEGETGKLKRLAESGTLVFVPTHVSHMDSLLMGWALHQAGLPAVTYGAGKNLFSNPVTGFFLQNLGAYKVDRRRRHTLYKNVLKVYSQVLLERGYHSMFFPGGGRTRDNTPSAHLKLGLLGTTLDAYAANIIAGRSNPSIFVVPVTISYDLVLEAETMIDDHLDPDGGRSIIEDDEFADLRRMAAYIGATLSGEGGVTIRFATPLDVFGNAVDQDGDSVDPQGRRVDPVRYLWVGGEPAVERERDMQYTRMLGAAIAQSHQANNIVGPIHIASFAIFEHIQRQHPDWDIARTLRFSTGDTIARPIAEGEIERVRRVALQDAEEGRYRIHRALRTLSTPDLLGEALRLYQAYHLAPIARADGNHIQLLNLRLLYYYSNRMRGYGIERRLQLPGGY
jgi:glycerol-3-phosphate O-acyltransferase